MNHFLSCDWGTTSLRIRLADTDNGDIIAEEISSEGIASTFNLWQQSGSLDSERVEFYLDILNHHIKSLEDKTGRSLSDVKVVISGMASSSIGIIEISYASAPVPVDGSGLQIVIISASDRFKHDVVIISGVRTGDDVMRGEETQLIGCIAAGQYVSNEVYIMPGTHSKHITVKDNRIADIKTYMTGELFDLLSNQSILKNTVEAADLSLDSFKQGLKEAASANLLHSIFKVRTNHLFDIYSKPENYSYLSGLLIGAELNDLASVYADTINLVCGNSLSSYYQIALDELFPQKNIEIVPPTLADVASVTGQIKIAKALKILV